MKIDLHIHTKMTKEGDGEKRNVTADKFIEKTRNVDIMAITNHNHFDLNQYNEFKAKLEDGKQIWPGVELDIKCNDHCTHLILVVSVNKSTELEELISTLVDNEDSFKIELDDLLNEIKLRFENNEALFFVHYLNKDPKMSEETFEMIESKVMDKGYIIFAEPTNYVTTSIMLAHDYRAINGSDVKDWDSYDDSKLPTLKIPVSSFEKFYLLCKKDKKILNTYMDSIKTEDKLIKISSDKNVPITLKNEVNVIFGGKGTGKSEIIKELKKSFDLSESKVQSYNSNDNIESFNTLKNKNINDFKASIVVDNCKLEIDECLTYTESTSKDTLYKYRKHIETCRKSNKVKNHSIMKMVYTSEHVIDSKLKTDINNLLTSVTDLQKLVKEYDLIKSERKQLIDIHYSLMNELHVKYYDDNRKNFEINSTNTHVVKIKKLISNKTQIFPKPNNVGFESFVNSRLELIQKIEKIASGLAIENQSKEALIGEIPDKGEIVQIMCNKILKSVSEKRDDGYKKITDQRELLTSLYKLLEIDITNPSESLREAKETLEDLNIELSLDSLTGFSSKVIRKETNMEYEPSKGETAILLVNKLLDDTSCDVYLFDELEVGFENNYITQHVIPKIEKIAKYGKVIVIATHNANIATHLYPVNTIYREYNDGKYETYIGNMFSGELKNTVNETTKDWLEKTLLVLEGSEEAFDMRRNIYGK